MSNQNKTKHLKITLLTLSFATLGFMPFANAGNSPFAQSDNQTNNLTVKGDAKKCGEGKCGDNIKKAKTQKDKKGTEAKTKPLKGDVQSVVQDPEGKISTEKTAKAKKKCGG